MSANSPPNLIHLIKYSKNSNFFCSNFLKSLIVISLNPPTKIWEISKTLHGEAKEYPEKTKIYIEKCYPKCHHNPPLSLIPPLKIS